MRTSCPSGDEHPTPVSAATPPAGKWVARATNVGAKRARREPYAVDCDRIVHSGTFRELQYKTQVQSLLAAGDLRFRTRLNHVIEVAHLARGIARDIGATEALAEAIALGHDLGHPPFGHAGERALRKALEDAGESGWNANVHSLAVVERIECFFVGFPGLDLTWATREGIARHSTPFDEPVSFGEFAETPQGGLECQIADAADVLAYISHDLDDALADGFIALEDVAAAAPGLAELLADAEQRWQEEGRATWPAEDRPELLRRAVVARYIAHAIHDLAANSLEHLTRLGLDDPAAVREAPERVVVPSAEYREMTTSLLDLLTTRYYRSDAVREADELAAETIRALFDRLLTNLDRVPARFHGERPAVAVASYLATLNDRSAAALAGELLDTSTAQASASPAPS